ncbi:MAG TPA: hypothetical protein VK211_16690 [Kamptonema sp.]|nr:hypothetical protein [Kamptonema sp.]
MRYPTSLVWQKLSLFSWRIVELVGGLRDRSEVLAIAQLGKQL